MTSVEIAPSEEGPITVIDILETVLDFDEASVELVAWEFDLPVAKIETPWQEAIDRGLLEGSEVDPSGETVRRVSALGRGYLQDGRDAAAA